MRKTPWRGCLHHDGKTSPRVSRCPGKGTVRTGGSAGFTLIEVIVSLVVAAILGTLLFAFMSGAMTRSVQPVLQSQQGSYLYSIMDNMTADYNNLFLTNSTPLSTFEGKVGTESSSRTLYSAVDHPYTIVHNRRISFPSGTGTTLTEQGDSFGKILKVTIEYRGLTLTTLFSE